MLKKIYIDTLPYEEIIERLDNGEKFYFRDDTEYYTQKQGEYIVSHYADGRFAIGDSIGTGHRIFYILEEVEEDEEANVKESEIDESYIGKLCWFWDVSKETDGIISTLEKIVYNGKFECPFCTYDFCEPLSHEEVEKFIKE